MSSKKILLAIFFLVSLFSCKSQYELLLQGHDTEKKYAMAFELFEAEKYAKSASMFESLKLVTKGTAQEDTVQYYTALAHYNSGDIYTAEGAFESFTNVFPISPFTEKARFLYIDCLFDQTLRYELDQTPTAKSIAITTQYLIEHPDSDYVGECKEMIETLTKRLDRKAYEAAKIYYTIEDYKAAHFALRNAIKENAENIYREDIKYYTVMSSYRYAFNSVSDRQKERYMLFVDDYYNFVGEYKESDYRKQLDNLFNRVQMILKRDVKMEIIL